MIVFTVSVDPRDETEAYRLGANAYVHKPFDLDTFIAAVKSIADNWSKSAAITGEGEPDKR
jgi:DNA-binding NarL/FixJ family response regulator